MEAVYWAVRKQHDVRVCTRRTPDAREAAKECFGKVTGNLFVKSLGSSYSDLCEKRWLETKVMAESGWCLLSTLQPWVDPRVLQTRYMTVKVTVKVNPETNVEELLDSADLMIMPTDNNCEVCDVNVICIKRGINDKVHS